MTKYYSSSGQTPRSRGCGRFGPESARRPSTRRTGWPDRARGAVSGPILRPRSGPGPDPGDDPSGAVRMSGPPSKRQARWAQQSRARTDAGLHLTRRRIAARRSCSAEYAVEQIVRQLGTGGRHSLWRRLAGLPPGRNQHTTGPGDQRMCGCVITALRAGRRVTVWRMLGMSITTPLR